MPDTQDYRSLLNRQRWLEFENTDSMEFPAYGALEITGVTNPDPGRIVLQCVRPTREAVGDIAFNSHVPVDAGGFGACTTDFPTLALFDDGGPANEPEYGIVADSFSLKGTSTTGEDNTQQAGFRSRFSPLDGKIFIDRLYVRTFGGLVTPDTTIKTYANEFVDFDNEMSASLGVSLFTGAVGAGSRIVFNEQGNYFMTCHLTVHNASAGPPVQVNVTLDLRSSSDPGAAGIDSQAHIHLDNTADTDGIVSTAMIMEQPAGGYVQAFVTSDDDIVVEHGQLMVFRL